MNFSLESVVVANDTQASADVAGEAVILNFDDGVYYGLNPVGTRVWQLLQEERSVQDIYNLLLQEYDVEPGLLEKDLFGLLADMVERQLVKIQDAPSS